MKKAKTRVRCYTRVMRIKYHSKISGKRRVRIVKQRVCGHFRKSTKK